MVTGPLSTQGKRYIVNGERYIVSGTRYTVAGERYAFTGERYHVAGRHYMKEIIHRYNFKRTNKGEELVPPQGSMDQDLE